MNAKKLIRVVCRYATDPDYRFLIRANMHRYDAMSDEAYLIRRYRASLGCDLNLAQPKTFNEKLQWLKLHDRKTLYTQLADKYLVRQYVAEKIGEEYLIPLISVWNDSNEIDFDTLPEQFVLKCNHNSGLGMYICRDKSRLTEREKRKIRSGLRKGLEQNYYATTREWQYLDIPRKILAEQYLTDSNDQLTDYKVHCFHGKPRFVLVCRDRFLKGGLTEDFYSTEWEHLDVRRPGHLNAAELIQKPACLSEMLRLSQTLSDGIPFLRVDFYLVDGRIYFGELTFFPMSGFGRFDPPEWDEQLGALLQLPAAASLHATST